MSVGRFQLALRALDLSRLALPPAGDEDPLDEASMTTLAAPDMASDASPACRERGEVPLLGRCALLSGRRAEINGCGHNNAAWKCQLRVPLEE